MQVSSVRRPRLLLVVAGVSLALLQACSSSGHANANPGQTTNASTASASTGGNPSSAPSSSGGSAAPTGSPLKIAIVAEMSGAGAATGQQWDDGVRWAIKQVNAQGGVLGHPFEALTTLDTQTVPSVSIAAMKKALQDDPYAIMGTIYSSSTQVNAPEVGAAGVPQFAGSQSDSLMNVSPTL
ncbi:MAG TPA: ABC transporter substrate-binding protein, partial [Candidatus Tumulicola sp.]|nr:ABC transporter substrate-binding protein [Candidatus Tumulicola sp.]